MIERKVGMRRYGALQDVIKLAIIYPPFIDGWAIGKSLVPIGQQFVLDV